MRPQCSSRPWNCSPDYKEACKLFRFGRTVKNSEGAPRSLQGTPSKTLTRKFHVKGRFAVCAAYRRHEPIEATTSHDRASKLRFRCAKIKTTQPRKRAGNRLFPP